MRVARFQVVAWLMVLSSLAVSCGDDEGGSACPRVPTNIDEGEACLDFCDAIRFDTGSEEHDGCVVSCECSGGDGVIDDPSDCFYYCDRFDVSEDFVMSESNTCICDRSGAAEEE